MWPLRSGFALALLLVVVPKFLSAQSTSGNLVGVVSDPTGAVIVNAQVSVRNNVTAVESRTASTSAGQYRLPNLPAGRYTLTVSAPGFNSRELTDIDVALNTTVTANCSLALPGTATSIDVIDSSTAIDTTTAQIETTFGAKQLQDLPTSSLGSGAINASLLTAGVGSGGGVGFGTGPSVGGQRPEQNSFTVEGIDNNSQSVTGPLITIPNDAIAEFSLLSNQFSPDFGHSSGGQFNQVVKSGSNEFHGMLYEYVTNRNFNAADNLNAVQSNPLHPRYDDNRFGGNIGGPIVRNKMFFFLNYEYNAHGGTASTFYDAPTQSGYDALATFPDINPTNLAQFRKYFGVAPQAAAATNLPFASPVFVGRGNEALGTQTDAIPVDVGQISSSLPSYINVARAVAAFDDNISDKDSLRARFILNRTGFIDTAGYPAEFFTTVPTNNYLVTLSEYHSFTSTLTNEFRLGYNRSYRNYGVTNQQYPGLDAFPNIYIYELNTSLGPDLAAPQFDNQNLYQITNNVSWIHGRHNFKFGFDGWKSITPQTYTQRGRGDYEYAYFSDFLFDNIPDQVAQRSIGNVTYYGDQFLLSWYGNDSWKLRPNLTLNLGLRYEYQTVPYSERLQTVNALASIPGVIGFNEPKPQATNLMPRIGLAFSPGTSGKTSVRAGFGINYDVLYSNLGSLSLPPQFQNTVDVTGRDGSQFLAMGGIRPDTPTGALSVDQARALTSGFIPNQKRPKTMQWNFGVQHVFAQDWTLDVRYLGARAANLPMQVQLNRQAIVTPSNALPVYLTAPSQTVLDSLPSTQSSLNDAYDAGAFAVQSFPGFASAVTAYMPVGNSTYHGLATQLSRRLANGLQMVGAYTWSHNIDDSTATNFSTVLTPRRPQDFQNLRAERASSALDHRQRLTLTLLYDLPLFKSRSWVMKNLIGNWEVAPIYTYETGELVTPQSQVDANLNGDPASDRVFINPSGTQSLGSDTTALTNSAGEVVAFEATNPNAKYIAAPRGTLPDGGRNLFHLRPINNIDLTAIKRINFAERYSLEFTARAFNLLNHPQYTGGYLNDVQPFSATSPSQQNVLTPGTNTFFDPTRAFSSNSRLLQLAVKFVF